MKPNPKIKLVRAGRALMQTVHSNRHCQKTLSFVSFSRKSIFQHRSISKSSPCQLRIVPGQPCGTASLLLVADISFLLSWYRLGTDASQARSVWAFPDLPAARAVLGLAMTAIFLADQALTATTPMQWYSVGKCCHNGGAGRSTEGHRCGGQETGTCCARLTGAWAWSLRGNKMVLLRILHVEIF